MEKKIGGFNHYKCYSLDKLAEFFRFEINYTNQFKNADLLDESITTVIFEKVSESLDFNVYLQRKIATKLKGIFNSDQFACIIDAFREVTFLPYDNTLDSKVKEILFEFIDDSDDGYPELGDKKDFKARIESMNQFEFEILVNLIVEIWGLKDKNVINGLYAFLESA